MVKKKVVIIIPKTVVGGAETMASQLAVYLDKSKFEVFFITLKPFEDNIVYQILKTDENIHLYSLEQKTGINLSSIRKMTKLLKRIKPDIIHTHLHVYPYVVWYCLFNRVKIIHTMHNMPIYESKKIGRTVLSFLFKTKIAVPVGISNIISDQTSKLYKLKDTITIYNPVDVKKFSNNESKNSDVFTIINAGRMTKQKNQLLLLEVFKKISDTYKNARLLMAGDGVLKEELFNYVSENNMDGVVTFLGNVNDIQKYYAQSNVFILSSIYEGLPMTILEAMAAGLPIISTNVGGVSDIVLENGILVESNSFKELYDAMEKLLNNNSLCAIMSEKSIEYAKQYDLSVIAKQYENVYLDYCKGKK